MQLRQFFLVILLVLVHLTLLINTRFTLWPEMVVYPYLLNNGFLLYKDLINPYPPFMTVFLSLFTKAFGYQPLGFQLLTWMIIVVIDLTIFFVSKAFSKNNLVPVAALIFFVIFSMPFGVNGLWFDLVQTPFILLAVYNLIQFLKYRLSKNFFYLTFLITLAFFIKQQAVWLILWFLLVLFIFARRTPRTVSPRMNARKRIHTFEYLEYLLARVNLKIIPRPFRPRKFIRNNQKIKKLPFSFGTLVLLLTPGILIFTVHLLFFFKNGIGDDFIFWSFQVPLLKASRAPGYLLFPTIKQIFIIILPLLISLPILFGKDKIPKYLIFSSLPLLFFAYPRFDYFHLVPYLSVVSLAAGYVLVNLKIFSLSQKSVSIIPLILLISVSAKYYIDNWQEPIRFFEPQIIAAANALKAKLQKGEHIYIQNGPDQLLPLSYTLPTKPWADEFPWYLEIDSIQQKIVEGLDKERPTYIVSRTYDLGDKYELGAYKPEIMAEYIESNYQNFENLPTGLILKKLIN